MKASPPEGATLDGLRNIEFYAELERQKFQYKEVIFSGVLK